MKFTNSNGDYLEIKVQGYEFPQLGPDEYDEYDANWLDISIQAKDKKRVWRAVAPCLLTWEAMDLMNFLRVLAEGGKPIPVYFEEPLMHFLADKFGEDICRINCGLWLDFHPDEQNGAAKPYYFTFDMPREVLAAEVDSFAFELAKYPRR